MTRIGPSTRHMTLSPYVLDLRTLGSMQGGPGGTDEAGPRQLLEVRHG